ncbi:hypothetical protein ACFSHT_23295 [Paraburkholderia silviterrae]|uniref:Lipoprotein n=1 Tax=Paraburkholderia silviterrae TaxID=2528715 RepID=A0A4R5M0K9_9BURK|nr:hypothetical protein [Paraburkholderia silviterrae]TDG18711.1 hypothetical protein EYW47_33540 [Paraburkholderia silviterrae]
MIFRCVFTAALIFAVSGCGLLDSTPRFQENCSRYGFKPGTDAFANCVLQQSQQEDDDIQRSMDRDNRLDAAGKKKDY